jgi:hypothetical protein
MAVMMRTVAVAAAVRVVFCPVRRLLLPKATRSRSALAGSAGLTPDKRVQTGKVATPPHSVRHLSAAEAVLDFQKMLRPSRLVPRVVLAGADSVTAVLAGRQHPGKALLGGQPGLEPMALKAEGAAAVPVPPEAMASLRASVATVALADRRPLAEPPFSMRAGAGAARKLALHRREVVAGAATAGRKTLPVLLVLPIVAAGAAAAAEAELFREAQAVPAL